MTTGPLPLSYWRIATGPGGMMHFRASREAAIDKARAFAVARDQPVDLVRFDSLGTIEVIRVEVKP